MRCSFSDLKIADRGRIEEIGNRYMVEIIADYRVELLPHRQRAAFCRAFAFVRLAVETRHRSETPLRKPKYLADRVFRRIAIQTVSAALAAQSVDYSRL